MVSFRCSEEERRRIKVAAAERDLSIQEMMLKAIWMYLDQENQEAAHADSQS